MHERSAILDCLGTLSDKKQANLPLSTYRLQFHSQFRFEDAMRLVPYLHALGVSHLYASPILKARTGSMHGYDIVDHSALNPEIGTEEDFHALVRELKSHSMALLLDLVPNHMAVGHGDNPWWQDVLENGPASEYSEFFDIDWKPLKAPLEGKVLIPVLGEQYGEDLEQGRIHLHYTDGRFFVTYYEKSLPIDPQTVPIIFESLGDLRSPSVGTAPNDQDRSELENIIWALRQLPPHTTTDPDMQRRRQRDSAELRARLKQLVEKSPEAHALIEAAIRIVNGEPGNPRSFDSLHRLLEAQAYRLAYWRVSAQEINYRRFFDINDLVGLRMDNPQVFAATHRLIRRLLADGSVVGLRIDHPDGLLNPQQYYVRLQILYAASQCCGPDPIPDMPLAENGIELEVQDTFGHYDWMTREAPLYVVAEKILERGEHLPIEWPVDGTVGYDFTNLVNGVLIDTRSDRAFTNTYRRFIGGPVDIDTMLRASKKLIMMTALSSEVTVLVHMLEEICSTDRRARDFTRVMLAEAIQETIACFPVYRTYIDERGNISERDRGFINEAITCAKRHNPGVTPSLFDFLGDILLLKTDEHHDTDEVHRERLQFTLKFQQLTGPVMAKGMEDTLCYAYNRFISINEVGGSPKEFGIAVDEFHRGNSERAENWPYSMLTTSTHDTKRSEDVRARLDVLSELPRKWATEVMRWRRTNRARKVTLADGRSVPDFNEEYLLYQTLVGAWPLEMRSQAAMDEWTSRVQQYMNKAIHEAKVNVSWINPDPDYSKAMEQFVARILRSSSDGRANAFLRQIEEFLPPLMFFGCINSLAQTLVKITAPGVPDTYQGNDLFDFSLVDPDNRRPVDFDLRRRLLHDLQARTLEGNLPALCDELLRDYEDGRVKMWVTMRALRFRQQSAALFQSGSYVPLAGTGNRAENLLAFARERDSAMAIVAVPRLSYELMKGEMRLPMAEAWGDTALILPHGGDFENVLTGEKIRVEDSRQLLCRELFGRFPVALLAHR